MLRKLTVKNSDAAIRLSFWVLSIALGFLQFWASRMTLLSDTVSYLDIGDYIWHGQWSQAVNGLWSPLYAAILGIAVGLFRPSFYWEYPLVHLILFLIFLFALWCFDFLLRELILFRQEQEKESSERFSVPTWVWLTIGYTLFLWSSLRLIEVSQCNPDMLVAAYFYLACGLLVRIGRGAAGWPTYVALGLALGLGYLTKSIMFPVSLICLASAFISGRRHPRRVLAAVVMFLAVSGPFIVALSLAKGRVTFGESGRFNYAVHVNHVPMSHWQGEIAGSGLPLHGTRMILNQPATFEFGSPIGGTYPPWTDPSYWYEGVRTRFDLRQAVSNAARFLGIEVSLFFELHGSLIAGLFVMFYVGGRKLSLLSDISMYWFLLVPSVATLGAYALIHVEPRYLAPFMVVFLLSLYLSVHLPASRENSRVCKSVAILTFMMFVVPIESPSLHLKAFARDILGRSQPDPNSPQEVVTEMYRLGLRPGDRIASLQNSVYGMSTWARLARVKIVSEVYYWPDQPETSANDFWKADPSTQERVIQALTQTGARFIVSQLAPPLGDVPDWQRVGNTQYYAYRTSKSP
jgi:hypothetical protein